MIGNKTIQHAVYGKVGGRRTHIEDTTSVSRPALEFMTDTVAGAGIMGEIELASLAQLGSLTYEIALRRDNPKAIALMGQKTQELEVTWAGDVLDQATGTMGVVAHKDIIRGIPKSLGGGTVENNAALNPTLSLEVLYWKYTQDGETRWEIDKLNNVCIIDGVDYAKPIRDAL